MAQPQCTEKNVRIQIVLPGATATNFWDVAGGSLEKLPGKMVMQTEDVVDAALAGLDQGELVTIPSLPDAAVGTPTKLHGRSWFEPFPEFAAVALSRCDRA